MDWEVIGVIAEVAGAIAVVVTLVYLSFQLRLAHHATQTDSSYYTLEAYGNWRGHLIDNAEMAAIVAKVSRGTALTDAEDVRVVALMDDLLIALAITYTSAAEARAHYGRAAEVEYLKRLLRLYPGLAPYWDRARDYIEIVSPEFTAVVTAMMSEAEFPLLEERDRPAGAPAAAN